MDLFVDRCRLCLEENSDTFDIFDKHKNFPTELSTCLSIEITPTDTLPKKICRKCARALHEFYEFYTLSKQSEKILLSYAVENNAGSEFSSNNNLEISNHPDNKYLSDYLDNINNSFDLDLLSNNTRAFSALDCLDGSSDIVDVTQKLLNNGVKLKKIPKNNNSNSADESIEIHMEIDVLDSELDIVNKILAKESQQMNANNANNMANSIPENYSCLSCKSLFNDFSLLAEHMMQCAAIKRVYGNKIHIKESKAVNDTKLKMINNQVIVTRRPKKTSDVNCVYRCKRCGIIFESKSLLYVHIKSYHMNKSSIRNANVSRSENDAFTTTEGHVGTHNKNHRINDSLIYRCKVCRAMCVDKKLLYDHIKEHAYDFKKLHLVCDTCGEHFGSYKSLSQHILTHEIHQCGECSEIFTDIELLKIHSANHNQEMLMCEACGSLFSTRKLLELHQKNECTECSNKLVPL